MSVSNTFSIIAPNWKQLVIFNRRTDKQLLNIPTKEHYLAQKHCVEKEAFTRVNTVCIYIGFEYRQNQTIMEKYQNIWWECGGEH
jgi:hypothetical protein